MKFGDFKNKAKIMHKKIVKMKNISNKTVTIPLKEYNNLKKIEKDFIQLLHDETLYHEETIDLFYKENRILKKELYHLETHTKNRLKKILQILTKKPLNQLEAIQQIQEAIGVVT